MERPIQSGWGLVSVLAGWVWSCPLCCLPLMCSLLVWSVGCPDWKDKSYWGNTHQPALCHPSALGSTPQQLLGLPWSQPQWGQPGLSQSVRPPMRSSRLSGCQLCRCHAKWCLPSGRRGSQARLGHLLPGCGQEPLPGKPRPPGASGVLTWVCFLSPHPRIESRCCFWGVGFSAIPWTRVNCVLIIYGF